MSASISVSRNSIVKQNNHARHAALQRFMLANDSTTIGAIHILDYKPDATTGKPFAQLTVYALALSHLTGIPLFDFKCAWFDERVEVPIWLRANDIAAIERRWGIDAKQYHQSTTDMSQRQSDEDVYPYRKCPRWGETRIG